MIYPPYLLCITSPSLRYSGIHISLNNMNCLRLRRFLSNIKNTSSDHKNMKSLVFTLRIDRPGILREALDVFNSNQMNIAHIQSKPADQLDFSQGYSFKVEVESFDDAKVAQVVKALNDLGHPTIVMPSKEVPWFPRSFEDLDSLDQTTMNAGAELESDHPGFNDLVYRKRRAEIATLAFNYRLSHPEVPRVKYTDQEIETWSTAYKALSPLHEKYACDEYNRTIDDLKGKCGFREDNIPQIQDLNTYLRQKTGFRLKPIAGLLSQRDFLNYLAFRVFASTQYIRHHSVPFYTPEPDIIHELIGHAPLFADPAFADFSQQIGLASLGVSDDEIAKIGTCYWFSVEFGIIRKTNGTKKVYGAGLLSSVDEILNAVSDKPEFRFFDPINAASVPFPITKLQPIYWYSSSFEEAKQAMEDYVWKVPRDVSVSFDKTTDTIKVHQSVTIKK